MIEISQSTIDECRWWREELARREELKERRQFSLTLTTQQQELLYEALKEARMTWRLAGQTDEVAAITDILYKLEECYD